MSISSKFYVSSIQKNSTQASQTSEIIGLFPTNATDNVQWNSGGPPVGQIQLTVTNPALFGVLVPGQVLTITFA